MRLSGLIGWVAVLCLAGCGVPGAPQPPSLGIPQTIKDLQAFRKGSTVTLTWTEPTETTDGELIRKPGKMIIARAPQPGGPFQVLTETPLKPAVTDNQRRKASVSDAISSVLSDSGHPDFLFYRVTSVSDRNRTSLPSNLVSVPAVETPPPPQTLALGLIPRGITVSFDIPPMPQPPRLSSQPLYRVMRRKLDIGASAEALVVGEVRPAGTSLPIVDSGIEWEKKYEYWVRPITMWQSGAQRGEVEGDDSSPVTILAHDTFPPTAPSGLEAVFSGLMQRPAIDLTWKPNTEDDLAGYNVYRHIGQETALKINSDLVKTPAFHDPNVTVGRTYYYSVTAVDLRGNESTRSVETSEAVPEE
jgi:hypothetical protein